jgi:HTH-type transcriptional regulator/antitoxin MqsA
LYLSKGNDVKKRPSKLCPNCETGHLHQAVRDVTLTRQKLSLNVQGIAGAFCDHCDEIEFDGTTDSAQRYAEAGDQLVLQNRVTAAATFKMQRKKLKLTQEQASRLTGGGHNAFSRYETGVATPLPAVVNLFSLLEKHPDMLKELDITG